MECCDQIVTDIRMLFTKGVDGKKWQWSDAGWGADWLEAYGSDEERLKPFSWKVAYESHGPCLTCMHVDGWYKNALSEQVELVSSVRTLRTDDYARTFTTLSYVFIDDLNTAGTHFFTLGGKDRVSYIETPIVAYGNKEGLIEEIQLTKEVECKEYVIKQKVLTGSPPWFIAFPGQEQRNDEKWGKGFRALIIRKYYSDLGGKEYINPSISIIGKPKHLFLQKKRIDSDLSIH